MKKVTLYLDDELWQAWRLAWLKRKTSASKAAEQVFREKLEALAAEEPAKKSTLAKESANGSTTETPKKRRASRSR